jgi:hypothetical protein
MIKLVVSYEHERDKLRIIELLSKGSKIIDIKKPRKTGKYTRAYIFLE